MKRVVSVGYRVANTLRGFYYFLLRPATFGVRCLIYHKGEVLLIKHSYGNKLWSVPGGGMHKKETKVQAVIREVREEVGLHIESLVYLGRYESRYEYNKDTVHCFYGEVSTKDTKIGHEISEARWYSISDIPEECAHTVQQCLKFAHEQGTLKSDSDTKEELQELIFD